MSFEQEMLLMQIALIRDVFTASKREGSPNKETDEREWRICREEGSSFRIAGVQDLFLDLILLGHGE